MSAAAPPGTAARSRCWSASSCGVPAAKRRPPEAGPSPSPFVARPSGRSAPNVPPNAPRLDRPPYDWQHRRPARSGKQFLGGMMEKVDVTFSRPLCSQLHASPIKRRAMPCHRDWLLVNEGCMLAGSWVFWPRTILPKWEPQYETGQTYYHDSSFRAGRRKCRKLLRRRIIGYKCFRPLR